MKTLVVLLSLALGAVAWADDTHVRSSATVEVLDDKAQIDDVISRLRTQQQQQQAARTAPSAPSRRISVPDRAASTASATAIPSSSGRTHSVGE
jgi:hypothetical protein